VGDRVVVPFTIACGSCFACKDQLWSCCDNSNRTPDRREDHGLLAVRPVRLYDTCLAGTPVGRHSTPAFLSPMWVQSRFRTAFREKVVFLSDIFPTGYMGAEKLQYPARRYGCRVGLAVRSRSFAIQELLHARCGTSDRNRPLPERLQMAREAGAENTPNFDETDNR